MKSIIKTIDPEATTRKKLQVVIQKKRVQLGRIAEKLESLKNDLDGVRYEYDTRIGKLYLKDNQLDLEILQYKQIQHLMEEGLSFEEASAQVMELAYHRDTAKSTESIDSTKVNGETLESLTAEQKDIKSLWKTLISHYHPDRIADPKEKLRREEIMKKINKAYSEEDVAALQFFQSQLYTEKFVDPPVELLEKTIVDLENTILEVRGDYEALRASAWFTMKLQLEKARKKQIDLFKDLERSLLDDIVKKIEVLKKLKEQMGVGEFV